MHFWDSSFLSILALNYALIYCISDESESLLYLVLVTSCTSVGKIQENEVFRINSTQFVPLHDVQDGGYTSEVWKLLNSGTFYFAVCPDKQTPIDLSLCAQRRHEGISEPDNRFFWWVKREGQGKREGKGKFRSLEFIIQYGSCKTS